MTKKQPKPKQMESYEVVEDWNAVVEYIRPLDDKHMVKVHSYFERTLMRPCWSIVIYRIGSGKEVTHEGTPRNSSALAQELEYCLKYARTEMLPRATRERKKKDGES